MDMPDDMTTLSFLKNKVKEFNTARNWEQYHTPKEVALSVSVEAAELIEIFQWRSLSTSDVRRDEELKRRISEEISDIMIYLIGMSNTLDIDLSDAILSKLEQNALKYPIKSQKN